LKIAANDDDSLDISITNFLHEDLNFSQLPYGMMRQLIPALLAAPIALASQTVFSVHDDLLAFPQVRISSYRVLHN
jgi:hypothetical protein